jgi:ATP/maltotriose-dependent transcriptional regulator MalT/two-component SAPR family response regulator
LGGIIVIQSGELPFNSRLVIPNRRGPRIRRPHLLEQMKAGVNRRVQVVCGPPGFGKTSLILDLAGEAGLPVCWYSLAPEDSDPAIFLHNCLQSIRCRLKGFGAGIVSEAQDSFPSERAKALGLLLSALQRQIKGRLIFVFDDVHRIHAKEELEQTLNSLVERASDNIHFVLGSRVRPTLKCLPKLAVDGDLTSINGKDLCFSTEETQELLGILWDRDVNQIEAQKVRNRTGGWPAVILLTAKNGPPTAHPDPGPSQNDADAGDEGLLYDYLSNEIFDKQPAPLKHFLMQVSTLKEFTAAQCSVLFGIENPRAAIEQIKDLGLFLEERVGCEAVYAFHELFRSFLGNRYRSECPVEHRASHYAAAVYFYEQEDYDSAIHHFIASVNYERAVGAIKMVAGSYYDQGKWQTLEALLDRLPRNVLEADPELILLRGQLLIRLGNPSEALTLLDRLTEKVDSTEIKGNSLLAKSTAYRRLGHLELAINAAMRGLEILLTAGCSPDYIAEAHKQLGNSYWTRGEYVQAKHHLQTGLELINKGNLRLHSLICNDLGATYLELGELDQAAVYLEQARCGLTRLDSRSLLADTLTNLALVYFHQGEFGLALDEIQNVIAIAEETNYPRVLAAGLMNQAIFQRAIGDHSNSLGSAHRALKLSNELLDLRQIAESTNVLGEAYRKLGETSKAEIMLRQALIEAEESGQRYIAATYNISLGKLYYQIGSYAQALESLGNAEEQLTELNSLRELAQAKLYQAAAYYRCGDIKRTLTCLSQTGALCPRDGFDGFLLADRAELQEVLRFGLAKRVDWAGLETLVTRAKSDWSPPNLDPTVQVSANPRSGFPGLRVYSLGASKVWLDYHEVAEGEWRIKKAKELFYYLLTRKNPASNEEIIEALWPDDSLERSASSLKTTVYRVRKALFFDCIKADDAGYRINPAVSVEFDLEELRTCLKLAGAPEIDRDQRKQYLSKAVGLHAGPFLGGYDSEWCDELRSDVEAKYHAAMMNLAAYETADGNFRQAIELLEKVIASDPWDEEAQYQRIQNHIKCEDPFLALQQLRKFAKLSVEELGCNLAPRFLECHQQIQRMMHKLE